MFARKVNVFIIRTVVVGVINIVTLYFTGHYMGPGPMGLMGFATSFIQMFFMFCELGFGQAHIKRISEGKDLSTCIGTYLTIKATIIFLLTIIIISFLLIKKFVFHSEFNDPNQEKVIYFLLIPVILVQLSTIPLNTYEAKKEAIKVSMPLIFAPLIKAPVTIVVAIVGYGVYGLVFARYISGLVLLIVAWKLLKTPIKLPNIEYIRSYFSFALNAFLVFIVMQLSLQIDKLLIGKYISTEAVGLYVSALSIIAILNVVPNAFGSLLFPTISKANALHDFAKIKDYTYLTEKYIGMVLIPLSLIIVTFSKQILFLIVGPKFINGHAALSILAFYFLINGMRKPYASLLAGVDKMKLLSQSSIISVIINISLNFILIPKEIFGITLAGLGINGAAIATLISGIVFSILCRIHTFKVTNIKSNKRIYLQYFAGLIMLAFFLVLIHVTPFAHEAAFKTLIKLCVFCISGTIVYFLMLILFKEFTRNDFILILDSINPVKMKSYFKSEINS